MIHNATKNGGHYGVSFNEKGILVQLMEGFGNHDQVRELLTPEEAVHFASLIQRTVEHLTNKPVTEFQG